jgi:hypothetical protein
VTTPVVEKIVEKLAKSKIDAPAPATNMQRAPSIRLDDAKAAWQPRPRMPSRLADTYVNFMVIGESGLGKTTFIKNLTQSYEVEGKQAHDGSSTSLNDFQADPYCLRTVLQPMDIPESSRRLMVSIQVRHVLLAGLYSANRYYTRCCSILGCHNCLTEHVCKAYTCKKSTLARRDPEYYSYVNFAPSRRQFIIEGETKRHSLPQCGAAVGHAWLGG